MLFRSRQDDKYWIINDSIIAESDTTKNSRPNGAVQDTIIAIYSADNSFKQFSFNGKKLYCGINPKFNTQDDRLKESQKIVSYLPGSKLDIDSLTIFYNGLLIFCRKFRDEKQEAMQQQMDEYKKSKFNIVPSRRSHNSGIESEMVFVDIINEWFLKHYLAKDCGKQLIITDTARFYSIHNLQRAIHVGTEHRKADVILECQDNLGVKSSYNISLKNRDSEEWTSKYPKCREIDVFLENALNDGLIECKPHYNKYGQEVFNHFDAKFTDGCSEVTAKMSKELADQTVFGTNLDRCDAVIIQSFTNGYQNEECIIHEKDDSNTCVGIFAVKRLALSIDDLMNTDYEPRLLLRKKSTGSVVINGATYHGIGLVIAFRSRVVDSRTGKAKTKAKEYEMYTEDAA